MDQFTPLQLDPVAEANHRVANSLALLGSLVRMQARTLAKTGQPHSNAEIRLMFDGIAARIATVGQLHRMLAYLPAQGTVSLKPHLHEICNAVISAFSSEHQKIWIEHHVADCQVLTKYVQPLTLIVCEVLTNAMKYAHPAGVGVRMRIACAGQDDGTLQISVSDDGVGLPEGFDITKDGGIGFQVIRALSAEMGADLKIHSDNMGVTFTLTVPEALVANARTA